MTQDVEIQTVEAILVEQIQSDGGEESGRREIISLRKRVTQLEDELDAVQGELRLLKRKFRNFDPNGDEYRDVIEKHILSVMDSQNWRISRLMLNKQEQRPRQHPRVYTKPTPTPMNRLNIRKRADSGSEGDENNTNQEQMDCEEFDDKDDPLYVPGRENMENRRPFTRKFNWKRQAIKKEVVATPVKKIARADEGNEGDSEVVIRDGEVAVIVENEDDVKGLESESASIKKEYRGRKKDEVWIHFVTGEANGRRYATCKACGKGVYPKAFVLKNHLTTCQMSYII